VSIGKKIAHKAEAAKGTGKKLFGRATGNTRLRSEGRVDQTKGNTKQAGAEDEGRLQTLTQGNPPPNIYTETR
jgi:uncharacterized protein YjbJ (UPF0337 family)